MSLKLWRRRPRLQFPEIAWPSDLHHKVSYFAAPVAATWVGKGIIAMKMTRLLAAAAVGLAMMVPVGARSAGPTTHLVMTRKAAALVTTPELKELLARNREALMCGVSFPDFGTALYFASFRTRKPDFGSLAHQPAFVEAYFDYVTTKCGPNYSGCERLLAHFLGVAAHDIEDRLYDEIFMYPAMAKDPKGRTAVHDLGSDDLFLVKYDPWDTVPRYWLPADDLAAVYRSLGMEVKPSELKAGRAWHQLGAGGLRATAWMAYPHYARVLSYTRDHIETAPGGVEFTAAVIARYWEILWKRLHGAGRMDEPVLQTWPQDGAKDQGRAQGALESRILVFFTTGMDMKTVTPETFRLQNDAGESVPVSFKLEEQDSVVILAPQRELAPATAYTIAIAAAVLDLRGDPLPRPYSFSFETMP
jgi:hypothetical protein